LVRSLAALRHLAALSVPKQAQVKALVVVVVRVQVVNVPLVEAEAPEGLALAISKSGALVI
jgi:hypothetical protein